MKWRPLLVLVLIAASCGAPAAPEGWSVERVSPTDSAVDTETALCADVRELALGSHAEDRDLSPMLDELARISALAGAAGALPLLNELQMLEDEPDTNGDEFFVTRHDLLVQASELVDDATATACGIPAFSALYATTGFGECHFEMEIHVAAYTTAESPGTCSGEGRPVFLPCWSDDANHLPVDCTSGDIVQAVGDR